MVAVGDGTIPTTVGRLVGGGVLVIVLTALAGRAAGVRTAGHRAR